MTVVALPVWKAGATAEERFLELAHLAREKPEMFQKVAVIYAEDTPAELTVRYISVGCRTLELVGLIGTGLERIYNTNLRHE